MRDFARKLIWDYGADGIYLDVLSSGRARPCFNPEHGHPLHGGTSWGQGNRQLLASLRQDIHRRRPGAFFVTEGCCEIYIDQIDGFLTLDVTRGGYRPPVMLLPLFTAVYHDYAIQYGSDCRLSQPTDRFCALLAEHFVWGAKPTLSEMHPPKMAEKPKAASYLRKVVRCYHRVGRKFLLEGKWLRPPRLDVSSETIKLTRKIRVDVQMPVVRRSLWRAPDGSLGLVVTNWTAEPHRVRIELDPAEYGLDDDCAWTQLWPSSNGTASQTASRELTLPPRSVRLFEIVPAGQGRNADEPPARQDQPYPFLVLRRENDGGGFPPAHVAPGTLWYGERCRLRLGADGELRVTDAGELDFALLRRHSVTLANPIPLVVDSRPGSGLILRLQAGARLTLNNPARCQIVARGARGPVEVIPHDGAAVVETGAAPASVWIAGPLDRMELTEGAWQYARKDLAARSQALARRWRARHEAGASLDELDALAEQQQQLVAVVEGLLGVRLEIELPATARALPFEPLAFALTAKNHAHKPVRCTRCTVNPMGQRHRGSVRLQTEPAPQVIAPAAKQPSRGAPSS